MSNGFLPPRVLLLGASLLCLAGCARSPQTRFYTLSPQIPREAPAPVTAGAPISVGVMPVEIPDYLNRPQIVTRDGRNELKLAEFDRWAGSLPDNMAAVLAENLSQLLASDRVRTTLRGRSAASDYALSVRVLQLDCAPGEQATLKAQWTLSGPPDARELTMRISTLSEKLKDDRYDTAVAAIGNMLERLSAEIAREIATRRTGG